jgi:hypothetical protein
VPTGDGRVYIALLIDIGYVLFLLDIFFVLSISGNCRGQVSLLTAGSPTIETIGSAVLTINLNHCSGSRPISAQTTGVIYYFLRILLQIPDFQSSFGIMGIFLFLTGSRATVGHGKKRDLGGRNRYVYGCACIGYLIERLLGFIILPH